MPGPHVPYRNSTYTYDNYTLSSFLNDNSNPNGIDYLNQYRWTNLDNYSTNPATHFGYYRAGGEKTLNPVPRVRYLGVELEVASKVLPLQIDHPGWVKNTLPDFVVCKADSSTGRYGFEICTAPAELEYQKKMWRSIFDPQQPDPAIPHMNQELISGNERRNSWGNELDNGDRGLHVHISKSGITPYTLGKMLNFLNNPAHNAFMVLIAGRDNRHYAPYHRHGIKLKEGVVDSGRLVGGKYHALNTAHAHTLELRIFAGTTIMEEFFTRLEFADSLAPFCSRHALSHLTLPHYKEWLSENSQVERYPHLSSFMAKG